MKKILKNKIYNALILILTFVFIFTFTNIKAYAKEEVLNTSTNVVLQDEKGEALNEAKNLINDYYVKGASNDVLNSSSIEEMIEKLKDPYSKYFTQEEYSDFIGSINDEFCGIGIYLDEDNEGIKVLSILKSSPSEEAGLKAGDVILKVDGISLKNKSLQYASEHLKGKEGTYVKVTVKRNNELLNFKIERKTIYSPTAISKVIGENLGYIRISSFGQNTGDDFLYALENLQKKDVMGYIVDLRFNGGGYVSSALDIAGYFIGDNPVVIMESKSKKQIVYNGFKHDNIIKKPIIFLVNEYSASASEILSAALKDYGKVFLIGKRTYGKGVAQNIFPLKEGGVLKITTFEFFSPKKNKIQNIGVLPDITVSDEEDSLQVAKLLLQGSSHLKIPKVKDGDLKEIVKKDGDNTIYIKFNKGLDYKSVNKNNIELLAKESGNVIPAEFLVKDGIEIMMNLKEKLKKNETYYLLVNDKIVSKTGKKLSNGEVVKISVK